MRRIISLVMVAAMLLSMMILPTSAKQANMGGGCKIDFTLGKTYSAYVAKDGVIGENEYQKIELNLDPETTDLSFTCYPDYANENNEYIEKCKKVLETLEFYASWDEVNGINFAVKYKPVEAPNQPGIITEDAVQNGDTIVSNNDDFLEQLGITVSYGMRNPMLDTDYGPKVKDQYKSGQVYYRAYSRKIENGVPGEYLVGRYGQGGLNLDDTLTQEILDNIINSTTLKDSKKTSEFTKAISEGWNFDENKAGAGSGVSNAAGKERGLVEGEDFTVNYLEDGSVIYEVSTKLDYVLFNSAINNGVPSADSEIYFAISICSGGTGYGREEDEETVATYGETNMYAVCIGDDGFHRESGKGAIFTNTGSFESNLAHATFLNDYFSDKPVINTVTFDNAGEKTTATAAPGASVAAPTVSYDGFTFEGWTAAAVASATEKPAVAGETITPVGDETYYALYSVVEDGTTFYTTQPQNGTHFKHDFSVQQSDATGHWNKCSKCDVIDAVAAHDFSVAMSDEANHWSDCSVCGYSDAKVPHDFSVVKYDDEGHWTECACGAVNNDKAAHQQGEAFDTLHPDPANGVEGYTKYNCTAGCGYVFTGEFTDHVYSVWAYDETNHWKQCSCTEKDEATVAAHAYVAKADETDHWQECECGSVIDKVAHTFEAKSDATDHWNECACGTVADKVAHEYTVVKYDDEGHWTECACGAVNDDKAEHTKGEVVEVVDPKDDEQGYTVYKCAFDGCEAQLKDDFVDGVKVEEIFDDIKTDDWFYDSVSYAYKNGLMKGKGEAEFAPNKGMTRAELVTVLWRMAGEPEVEYAETFSDVAEGEWYTSPVLWAAENEIVKGFEGGEFRPSEGLTRDQLAAIMYRYTAFTEGDTSAKGDITVFPDADSIQEWAVESIEWAVGAGLLTGKKSGEETVMAPKAPTTRAEVATILMRYGA